MPLRPVYRVAIYVPPEYVDRLLAAVCEIVPLRYGKYDRSAWWIAGGTEQYEPIGGATPSHGQVGQISRVSTTRLEFCVPHDRMLLEKVIQFGVRPNHPWEEPAILVDEAFTDTRDQGQNSLIVLREQCDGRFCGGHQCARICFG